MMLALDAAHLRNPATQEDITDRAQAAEMHEKRLNKVSTLTVGIGATLTGVASFNAAVDTCNSDVSRSCVLNAAGALGACVALVGSWYAVRLAYPPPPRRPRNALENLVLATHGVALAVVYGVGAGVQGAGVAVVQGASRAWLGAEAAGRGLLNLLEAHGGQNSPAAQPTTAGDIEMGLVRPPAMVTTTLTHHFRPVPPTNR